jgi:hypothetical protein
MICPPQTSGGQIKKHGIGGNVKRMKVRTGVCEVLVGKRKRKRPPGRARCKWELNIKTDVMNICWRAWSALIWMCENAICEIHLYTCIRSK